MKWQVLRCYVVRAVFRLIPLRARERRSFQNRGPLRNYVTKQAFLRRTQTMILENTRQKETIRYQTIEHLPMVLWCENDNVHGRENIPKREAASIRDGMKTPDFGCLIP